MAGTTVGDLQLQLNVSNQLCYKYRMTVNQDKSRVIHFRWERSTRLNIKQLRQERLYSRHLDQSEAYDIS